jgi:cytoskeletal protein RodZ
MVRRYEQGSVVGFVIIGILLTTALVAGVWLAHRPADSTQTASNSDSESSSSSEQKDTTNTSGNNNATTDEQLKDTLSQQSSQSSTTQSSSSTVSGGSNTSSTSHLPATGPADTLIEVLGATLLVGTAVAYFRSRSLA